MVGASCHWIFKTQDLCHVPIRPLFPQLSKFVLTPNEGIRICWSAEYKHHPPPEVVHGSLLSYWRWHSTTIFQPHTELIYLIEPIYWTHKLNLSTELVQHDFPHNNFRFWIMTGLLVSYRHWHRSTVFLVHFLLQKKTSVWLLNIAEYHHAWWAD